LHISSLGSLSPHQQAAVLRSLKESECEALLHDWRFLARPEQLAPEGDWGNWLVLAGRGFGKTRTGAEWVRNEVKAGARWIGLIAPTAADARAVMVEGESGVLSVCWAGDTTDAGELIGTPFYEPSKRRLTWANGAVATLFSAEEPERLRGPQHDRLWCDELASWTHLRDTWDMARFGLRLGEPRTCITTTPKPLPLIKEILADPRTVLTRGATYANAANLAPSFIADIRKRYEGTRLGRQELNAEILDDLPGALWSRDMIEACRVRAAPQMVRVVVAVDPSGTSGGSDGRGDDVGIVVAGKGPDGHGYVLADRTCNLSPDGWGRRVVDAYREFSADRIVAERNYGGAMVEHVIRMVDRSVSYREVTASRGKIVRAEPVAALYEQGKVHHVGAFPQLEDQMALMASDGFAGEGSPDRADALVWALTELMVELGITPFAWHVGG
jgi:phage terminase large subunit-like protein